MKITNMHLAISSAFFSCFPEFHIQNSAHGVYRLRREALSAGAVGDGVRIGDFEASLLQVVAVVEFGAADKEGALRINDDIDALGWNQDVTRHRTIDEIHFVLEAGTAPADDSHTECPLGTPLFFEQGGQSV